jgi:large subunit ribosomal protein L48
MNKTVGFLKSNSLTSISRTFMPLRCSSCSRFKNSLPLSFDLNQHQLAHMSTSQAATNRITKKIDDKQENLNKMKDSKRIRLVELLNTPKKTSDMETFRDNNELRFYDPPYLKREAPFPNYDVLNISIKGYDFTTLDHYYEFIEKLCNVLKVNVIEAYPMPARSYKIKTYQPFSSNLDKEYSLKMYHRIVRISNLKSTMAPILFESIQLNLPEGVDMTINVPNEEEDQFRYIPDIELNQLKSKLDEMSKKPKADVQAALQEEAKKQAAATAATAAAQAAAAKAQKAATVATNTKAAPSPTKK